MLHGMDTTQKKFPILVADIGGTNATIASITRDNGRYQLVDYYTVPSQKIGNFTQTIYEFTEKIAAEKHIRFSVMVIGLAGVVSDDAHVVHLTNVPFAIDKADLIRATGIAEIVFINDFLSVAYGYEFVANTLSLTSCPQAPHAQKAFIGAGTGLGQSYTVWSEKLACHIAVASEGGHTAWAPYDSFDAQLAHFIQEKELSAGAVTWENVLSGKGISHIYEFLGTQMVYSPTDISREIAHGRFQPDFISRYSGADDERSKKTFRMYRAYYARYAQQVALQSVARGGLYIAGGIAAKNKKIFLDPAFRALFTEHAKHRKLLEKIPLFLIQDYQVNLYGAAHYYTLRDRGII